MEPVDRKKIRPALLMILKITGIAHILLLLIFMIMSLSLNFYNPEETSLMKYRIKYFQQKARPLAFIPLEQIPAELSEMIIKLEDDTFYTHHGIRPSAILFAWTQNRKLGNYRYGGSTITQQLARTLFLNPKKNYLRKYLEAWLALEMDLFLSKDRILELYLNYAEWGKGVFGIGAAAYYHFEKNLQTLSLDELKRLAIILPGPRQFRPHSIEKKIWFPGRYSALSNFIDTNLFDTNISLVYLTNQDHLSNQSGPTDEPEEISTISNTVPAQTMESNVVVKL